MMVFLVYFSFWQTLRSFLLTCGLFQASWKSFKMKRVVFLLSLFSMMSRAVRGSLAAGGLTVLGVTHW